MNDRGQLIRSLITTGPAALWLGIFLALPLLALTIVSFLTRGTYGQIAMPVTLDHYLRLLGFGQLGFDPLYPVILLRSLALGAMTILCCIAAGFPLAFYIASLSGRWRNAALTLVVIPLWVNLLIRTYAWQILLSPESLISRLAALTGLVMPGQGLYPGYLAVLLGMVCDFLPFFVLPLYASVEKMDWTLVEAAMDLGASGWRIMRHAILPQVMPGLVAGGLLVFIPATGQFVIPDLLGGAKTWLLGNAIQQEFGSGMDWPFGAAITVVSLALVLSGLWLYARAARNTQEADWL